jgi:SAM-dependent methyltransferase
VFERLSARIIRATTLIDTAYRRFDRARSLLVTRFASDAVIEAFNDLTYGSSAVYKPEAPNYRRELFNWEIEAIARVFPPAPGRVLVGGAGGGREAFGLAERGYEVVAFEPSPDLAASLAGHAAVNSGVRGFIARYEDLPVLRPAGAAGGADLTGLPRFDAALFGWTSFSHLRGRARRVEALRAMAAVTDGPVILSFYLSRTRPGSASGRLRRLAEALGFRPGADQFTTHVGYYHLSTPEELRADVRDAGLEIVVESYDDSDGRWPYVAVRRP